ncbi:MAG: flagellar biosynthesis anti-sigma factor FlgM [Planctomycetota bacterium]|nr:flagellar biosynthesis anti-sigma factor FlgM [Planctomycetota bacterium]MCZ6815730.1 flagellar biosynthesis anti-sigma factor FlgM [Planctomycetota bacterium]
MNEISTLGGLANTATLRDFLNDASPRSPQVPSPDGSDRIEISEWARFLSRLAELPDVRVEKVANVRSAIDRGDYESAERLDRAIDRLVASL